MEKPSNIIPISPKRLGNIIFSPSREIRENVQAYSRVFICRKGGFDFIGQIKIDLQEIAVNIELFNTNYFDYFDAPLKNVTLTLENTLLTKLLSKNNLPKKLTETIASFLKNKEEEDKNSSTLECINDCKINLKEIFDKLNSEYFQFKIKANIEW